MTVFEVKVVATYRDTIVVTAGSIEEARQKVEAGNFDPEDVSHDVSEPDIEVVEVARA